VSVTDTDCLTVHLVDLFVLTLDAGDGGTKQSRFKRRWLLSLVRHAQHRQRGTVVIVVLVGFLAAPRTYSLSTLYKLYPCT
jgi:hypothetical protein